MVRQKMIDALKEVSKGCGYELFVTQPRRTNSQTVKLPAIAIEQPKLISKTGTRECRAIYRVVMKLMCVVRDQADQAEWLARMESDLFGICDRMQERDFVVSVEGIKSSCGETAITTSGEISLEGSVDIEVIF